jgi:hypothetical protein
MLLETALEEISDAYVGLIAWDFISIDYYRFVLPYLTYLTLEIVKKIVKSEFLLVSKYFPICRLVCEADVLDSSCETAC